MNVIFLIFIFIIILLYRELIISINELKYNIHNLKTNIINIKIRIEELEESNERKAKIQEGMTRSIKKLEDKVYDE